MSTEDEADRVAEGRATAAMQDANLATEPTHREVMPLPNGFLETWFWLDRSPPERVTYFVDGGEYFRPNESWSAWQRLLSRGQVDIRDLPLVSELIAFAPGIRRVPKHEHLVPKQYRAHGWRPSISGAEAVWLCNDYATGSWEEVHVSLHNGEVSIVRKGEGNRIR